MKEYKLSSITTGNDLPAEKITSSKSADEIIRKFYFQDIKIYESFFILLLNRANFPIGWAKISQGGVSGTIVDPKIVAKYAIDVLASGIILCHNHPSGNLNPSLSDQQITDKLIAGLKLLDINVLDHMIITEDSYYSFADNDKINN